MPPCSRRFLGSGLAGATRRSRWSMASVTPRPSPSGSIATICRLPSHSSHQCVLPRAGLHPTSYSLPCTRTRRRPGPAGGSSTSTSRSGPAPVTAYFMIPRRGTLSVPSAASRPRSRSAAGNYLGQERVEIAGGREAWREAAVHPHARAGGFAHRLDDAERRQEAVVRVLCPDPALHRVAAADDLVPAEAERLTRGDAELRLDQIHSRHHLCHGVLDLQAGVDLDAVKGLTGEQELHGAGVDVAHGAGRSHRGRSQALPQVRSERR